jgi:glutaredoxin
MRFRSNWASGFLIGILALSTACRRHADLSVDPVGATEVTAADTLPPLTVRDDSENLLLTWVGDDGDFHVVEKIDGVPAEHRKQVRVVSTNAAPGTGVFVYVADLTALRADGTYTVTTLPRSEWEKLGADRRKTRIEALAPGKVPPPADSAQPGPSAPTEASAAVSAIVYGADWCKPCHDAERYLKSLGVSVTKKNIEESRAAQAEMREKLARVNRNGAGIPVIDVMGKIFVGYSPGPLKQAVDAARHGAAQKRG